ncbi:AAA family ATPase [Patescibacteria group bacterium]|nr:AAA family ATPase [Patescibacteria group bacterium]
MIQPIKLDEFIKKDIEKPSWVAERLIPKKGTTFLAGYPESFKTWILIELARCVASGGLLFGKIPCPKGKVLIINEEDNESYIKNRILQLRIRSSLEIYLLIGQGIKVDDPEKINFLSRWVKENNITLVCLDSFARIHTKEENISNQIAMVFEGINQLKKAGASVLITHHLRKKVNGQQLTAHDLRGSSDILAAVDCSITMQAEGDIITINQNKLRTDQKLKPFAVEALFNRPANSLELICHDEIGVSVPKQEIDMNKILAVLDKQEHRNRGEIVECLKGSLSSKKIDPLLKRMVQKNMIKETPGKHNAKFYFKI